MSYIFCCQARVDTPESNQIQRSPLAAVRVPSNERFDRGEETVGGGTQGGTRVFSAALWGTLVHPDETARLEASLREGLFSPSPFISSFDPQVQISKKDAGKHAVHVMMEFVKPILTSNDSCIQKLQRVSKHLAQATLHYQRVAEQLARLHLEERPGAKPVRPMDKADAYHEPWMASLARIEKDRSHDLEYIDALSQCGPA